MRSIDHQVSALAVEGVALPVQFFELCQRVGHAQQRAIAIMARALDGRPAASSSITTMVATAAFEAYWGNDLDIAQEAVLADVATHAGLERQRFFSGIETDSCKARLRTNTDELIARGGFGSPTIFVGDQMFFGNDRMPLIRAALEAA